MNVSSTPFLLIAVLTLLGWAAQCLWREGRLDRAGRNALWILLAALLAIAVLAAWLGLSGVSTSAAFLAAWPTWWYPFLPVVLLVSAAMLSGSVLAGLRALGWIVPLLVALNLMVVWRLLERRRAVDASCVFTGVARPESRATNGLEQPIGQEKS